MNRRSLMISWDFTDEALDGITERDQACSSQVSKGKPDSEGKCMRFKCMGCDLCTRSLRKEELGHCRG